MNLFYSGIAQERGLPRRRGLFKKKFFIISPLSSSMEKY